MCVGRIGGFFKKRFANERECFGVDISPELIANAKERFRRYNIDFSVGSVADFKLPEKVDCITLSSVLCYFDDPYPVLKHILGYLKEDGLLIVTDMFNLWNVEVRTKYKLEDKPDWRTINQFGLKNFMDKLKDMGYQCTVTDQIMPFDIAPKEHPIRSWTVNLNGTRHMMCGLHWVYNIQIVQVTKSKKLNQQNSQIFANRDHYVGVKW